MLQRSIRGQFFVLVTLFAIILASVFMPLKALARDALSPSFIKATFVYNFLKHIEWPGEKTHPNISVVYWGGNDDDYENLQVLSKQKAIRGHPIIVSRTSRINMDNLPHVLVLGVGINSKLSDITHRLKGKGVLIVSDDSPLKQLVMLNFSYAKAGRVAFELNRYNIVYENLKLSSDILLLAGTELDIAELIKDMEGSMRSSQEKLQQQTKKLKGLHNEVQQRERQLNEQQEKITNYKKRFDTLSSEFDELNGALDVSRNQLDSNNLQLSQKLNEITKRENLIESLSSSIVENTLMLKQQNDVLASQKAELGEQETALNEQSTTIETQNTLMLISLSVITVIAVLIVFIYRSNRANVKANHDLEGKNQQLAEINAELEQTQDKLAESKKMAALGGLVAGVAHEINTPLGIGVTAISYMMGRFKSFDKDFRNGLLKRSELETLIKDALDSGALLESNLTRASDLIKSFKLVAVDQTSEYQRHFFMKDYIEDVCQSLVPQYHQTKLEIEVNCDPNLGLISYPGAFSQVLTNLVMNSITHGFCGRPEGKIILDVSETNECVMLIYRDDGYGISEEHRGKVFDPFYTTKRGSGGSGLGLNICYNLVTQKLCGNIRCLKSDSGAVFELDIPMVIAS